MNLSQTPKNQSSPRHALRTRLLKDEINALPLVRWEGATRLITTREELDEIIPLLLRSQVLGFDTETRPAFRKGQSYPPSLLQLATDQMVFVLRLQELGMPAALADLLGDRDILKVGVAVQFDTLQLQQIGAFSPGGFCDLADMSRRLGLKHYGLRGLAAVVLGKRISKTVRTTNWADPNLTQKQIQYAATDAWISREIYLSLAKMSSKTHHYDS